MSSMGGDSGQYSRITPAQISATDVMSVFVMDGLEKDETYYYRLIYRKSGENFFGANAERSFKTQKSEGESFAFVHMTDSHLGKFLDIPIKREIIRDNINQIDLENPDFVIDTGDTYMTHMLTPTSGGCAATQSSADSRYSRTRDFFEVLNSPYFFALGNHDGEVDFSGVGGHTLRLMNLSENARLKYLPNPYDAYGGGEKGNYHAFEWGGRLIRDLR